MKILKDELYRIFPHKSMKIHVKPGPSHLTFAKKI